VFHATAASAKPTNPEQYWIKLMKIKIDANLCTGHGRCYFYADEVYDLDDNGYSIFMGKTVDVDPAMEDKARLGARNCPEQAIEIIED
jgi:ferredoxin